MTAPDRDLLAAVEDAMEREHEDCLSFESCVGVGEPFYAKAATAALAAAGRVLTERLRAKGDTAQREYEQVDAAYTHALSPRTCNRKVELDAAAARVARWCGAEPEERAMADVTGETPLFSEEIVAEATRHAIVALRLAPPDLGDGPDDWKAAAEIAAAAALSSPAVRRQVEHRDAALRGAAHHVAELLAERDRLAAALADAERRIAVSRLVADHWRQHALTSGDTGVPARLMAHPLNLVQAALDGETDPERLGVDSDSPAAGAIRFDPRRRNESDSPAGATEGTGE